MSQVQVEEQKALGIPKTAEDFPKPLTSELELPSQWVLWEQWKLDKNCQDYDKSLKQVAAFNDVISFWQVWNNLEHANLTKCFSDPDKSQQVYFEIQGEKKIMDAIDVFKFGIKPAWEDSNNNGGTQFNWKASETMSLAQVNQEWEKLVMLSITGDSKLPHHESINGVRVIDKKKHIRFEIWCKLDREKEKDKCEEMQKAIASLFEANDLKNYKIAA